MLNARQEAFVREYLLDGNATQSAKRAGYSEKTAYSQGSELLKHPEIVARLATVRVKAEQKTDITAQWVLDRLKRLAEGDEHNLVQHRRCACRHCYGAEFRYMETPAENAARAARYLAAVAKAKRGEPAPVFETLGGVGYDKRKQPHPDCPECNGEGFADVFMPDTRNLTREQRALFAGAKRTKEGIEMKTHTARDALLDIGKHIGMFKDAGEVTANVNITIKKFGE